MNIEFFTIIFSSIKYSTDYVNNIILSMNQNFNLCFLGKHKNTKKNMEKKFYLMTFILMALVVLLLLVLFIHLFWTNL